MSTNPGTVLKGTAYAAIKPERVISEGQTGVDRAALDWAIDNHIPHGGWCPRGHLAIDGPLAARYQLQEASSEGYSRCTRYNVRDADATLIIHHGVLEGGSSLTLRFAKELSKPVFVAAVDSDWVVVALEIRSWLAAHHAQSVNVAGPSETRAPGIYERAYAFMDRLWASA